MNNNAQLEPLVSVMMPTYNSSEFLCDALESIINQTYSNWELIVVDDGSTDNTSDIVLKYAAIDDRITYRRIEHSGRGTARSECIRLSKGKYIAVCDSDDVSEKTRFEQQVRFLNEHPEIGVVSSFLCKFTDKVEYKLQNIMKSETSTEKIANCFNKNRMCVPNASSMIRKELFDQFGLYNPLMLRAQDYEFYKRLHLNSIKFFTIDRPLVFYRQDNLFPSAQYYIKSLSYIRYGDFLLNGGDQSFDHYTAMPAQVIYRTLLLIKYYTLSTTKYNLLRYFRLLKRY